MFFKLKSRYHRVCCKKPLPPSSQPASFLSLCSQGLTRHLHGWESMLCKQGCIPTLTPKPWSLHSWRKELLHHSPLGTGFGSPALKLCWPVGSSQKNKRHLFFSLRGETRMFVRKVGLFPLNLRPKESATRKVGSKSVQIRRQPMSRLTGLQTQLPFWGTVVQNPGRQTHGPSESPWTVRIASKER